MNITKINNAPIKTLVKIQPQTINFKANDGKDESNNKNLLLGAGILASTAVAAIALYKNKKANGEIKKVVEELKNSKDNIKKAEEKLKETNSKIEELKKSIEELKNKLNNNNNKIKQDGTKTNNFFDFLSDLKNKIQVKYYEFKLDRAYKKEQEKLNFYDLDKKLAKAKKKSDARNQKWINKQHNIKEKEYNKLFREVKNNQNYKIIFDQISNFFENLKSKFKIKKANQSNNNTISNPFAKIGEFFSDVKNKIQTKYYERKLDKAFKKEQDKLNFDDLDKELAKATKKSDAKNQKWINKQHDIQEKEYNELFKYHD